MENNSNLPKPTTSIAPPIFAKLITINVPLQLDNLSPSQIIEEMCDIIETIIKAGRTMEAFSILLKTRKDQFNNFTSEEINTVPEDLHEKFEKVAIELMKETIKIDTIYNNNINNNMFL